MGNHDVLESYRNLLYCKDAGIYDETLLFEGKVYYRYMDSLYIPNPPCQLSKENVQALSELRIKRSGVVLDLNYSKRVIGYLLEKIGRDNLNSIIDFGCGGGLLADVFMDRKDLLENCNSLLGLDISSYAVEESFRSYMRLSSIKKIKIQTELNDERVAIDLGDGEIDSIISSFAMHFNIYESQIAEIYRVLKSGGVFCYNDYVYHKYPAHSKKIIKWLEKVGFSVESTKEQIKDTFNSKINNHLIVFATKK